ncbi:MAG: hypothetical protein WD894_03595 [Pirellulales bacterium]
MAGGVMATIVLGVVLIVTIGFAIVAFVGRDELRAAAIGFLVPVIVYAASIFAVGSSELDPYEGKLPTTKLIQPAFRLIVRAEWVNVMTGEPMPDYDPTNPGPYGAIGPAGPPVGLKETPDRTIFMSVAHALLAMVFGYAGSKFAVYVYRRQKPLVKAAGAE